MRETLPSPCHDHSLIDLSRQPYIIQVIFPDFGQSSCVIKVEHEAPINLFGLTRLQAQRPCQIIKAHAISRAELPAQHRVEDASRIVFAEIHKRRGRNVIDETALKDEGEIETQYVVTHDFVRVGMKV